MKKTLSTPPKLAAWILRRIAVPEDKFPVLQDLNDDFHEIVSKGSLQKARFLYCCHALKTAFIILLYKLYWRNVMLNNYSKIALRNIRRQKVFSLINIAGLALGLICSILILIYVQFELSYDRFHEKSDRIYRVVVKQPGNMYQGSDTFGVTYHPLGPALVDEFPAVVNATHISGRLGELSLRHLQKNQIHINEKGYCVDPEFFKVFSFPFVNKDMKGALDEPYTMVISEDMENKYFPNGDAIGQTFCLEWREESYDLTVTGILENVPKNSHLQFDYLISFATTVSLRGREDTILNWSSKNCFTYIELDKDYPHKELEKQLIPFIETHGSSFDRGFNARYLLQPLTDIHLRSHINFEISNNSDIKYVYIFSAVAFGILMIACINFMNLSTARASRRAKEVGLRKVIGASRSQLIKQFMGESIILSLFAFFVAIVLVIVLLPSFSAFVERGFDLEFLKNPSLLLLFCGIILFVGVFSGSYPALVLSSFNPVKSLKDSTGSISTGVKFRFVLVIFQFSISIILIFCTITVFNQLSFIRNKNIGYNRENVLVVPFEDDIVSSKAEALKNDFLRNSHVLGVSTVAYIPTKTQNNTFLQRGENLTTLVYYNDVDYDFLDVFEMELITGRNFSKNFATDSSEAIIINETAAELIEGDNLIGNTFPGENFSDYRIIGVVKDFHFSSLHLEIEPMMIRLRPDYGQHFCIRVSPDSIPGTLEYLKSIIHRVSPEHSFAYYFLDDSFNSQYRSDQRFGVIFTLFSALSIFISCLGIFGLASFMAERRTKEIGIRRILGASSPSIILDLFKDFTKWVIISNIIAWPVAYVVMTMWLQNFAYKIDINLSTFILSGVIALGIALFTASYQSVKAATTDPVHSLRYE